MDCPERVAYSLYFALLDDFLIISPSNESCQHQLDTFLMLCSFLGIPMAPEKTVGPSTTLAFAGIQLDTALMEARLTQEKLDKCQDLLSTFLRNSSGDSVVDRFAQFCLYGCCPRAGILAQVNRFEYGNFIF